MLATEYIVYRIEYCEKGEIMSDISRNQEQVLYVAEDIREILQLSKSKVYEYLQQVYREQQPFRVIKIGKLFRIPKQSFDAWLYGDENSASEVK